jgi:branched-chain amino acid aminotransferase
MSGTYPNSVLATLEATQHGYDEGLLLDVDGFVAEGAGENIFMVKDGIIWEPELTSALTGITRSSVIELAQGLGYAVRAKRLTRDDIYIADECFFTGTAAEVTPIRELDGRRIGEGKAGPVTKAIQKAFFDVVTGKDKKHRKWLTPVRCPQPGAPLWSRHPRVFLDVTKTGEALCPYCGTKFQFSGKKPKGH